MPDSLINKDDGRRFWHSQAPDDNAMIGGSATFPNLSQVDLDGSRNFLVKVGIGKGLRIVRCVLEGGAGYGTSFLTAPQQQQQIGRFTRGVLLDVTDQVDVIEPIEKFTERLKGVSGIRNISNLGLEEWEPFGAAEYDLIWNQGCICHLSDAQVVQYLEKCKSALRSKDGLVIVKENLSIRGADVFDSRDSTVLREDRKFLSLFQQAGLRLVKAEFQRGLPATFLPVKMYALAQREED
ncbi:Alpha N-terminal protein methyltransferase 1 [Madurella mycetomatis]|uniref:Alpha N-terminal protein methyltransferase 1 n=1 Tax=Madurella mycetomatis TaxID=100816 RepID=A0A175VRA8_9PEZI|nr:Alpha N-terminal protein methyltransferase 1 [Madurella mycetomatis]